MPVKMYVGGVEHATKHLMYARFLTKFLKDIEVVHVDEPFTALRNQGLILGPGGRKMSKSKGNVVNPDDLVKEFGTDAVRMYLCFVAEYAQGGPWNPKGILGVTRFLERVWKMQEKVKGKSEKLKVEENTKLERILHQTIKKVGEDIEELKFNTAVSALMICLNEMEAASANCQVQTTHYQLFLRLLAPFTPHIVEEIWIRSGNKKSIHTSDWPKYDQSFIHSEKFTLVIQVNGKTRDTMTMAIIMTREEIEKQVLESKIVKKHLDGKKPTRIVYVPQKLINIVV